MNFLLLHGFTGSSRDWLPMQSVLSRYGQVTTPDLPGHGSNILLSRKEFYSHLNNLSDTPYDTIIGYSMGGRVALDYIFEERLSPNNLILISSTAGIEAPRERKLRWEADQDLAQKIRNLTPDKQEEFFHKWYQNPIFESKFLHSTIPTIITGKIFRPEGWAWALREFSSGKLAPRWEQLREIQASVLLISGDADEKYMNLQKKMMELIPHCDLALIREAGHLVHQERPQEVLDATLLHLTN